MKKIGVPCKGSLKGSIREAILNRVLYRGLSGSKKALGSTIT